MQLEWEFELKVKCLDIRSFKQHTCNDKHNKLLHANETYQLKVVLYADLILTNHKFVWCMQRRETSGGLRYQATQRGEAETKRKGPRANQ